MVIRLKICIKSSPYIQFFHLLVEEVKEVCSKDHIIILFLLNKVQPIQFREDLSFPLKRFKTEKMEVYKPLVLLAVLSLTMAAEVELPMNWIQEYSSVSRNKVSRNEMTLNHFSIQNISHFLPTSTVNVIFFSV